jgi:hypothetical protein
MMMESFATTLPSHRRRCEKQTVNQESVRLRSERALWNFDWLNVYSDDDAFVIASYDEEVGRFAAAGISFLVRNIRRKVYEITWPYIRQIFEPLPPTYLAAASYDVNRNFMTPMMMRAGLPVRCERNGADPGFSTSHAREVKRGRPPARGGVTHGQLERFASHYSDGIPPFRRFGHRKPHGYRFTLRNQAFSLSNMPAYREDWSQH